MYWCKQYLMLSLSLAISCTAHSEHRLCHLCNRYYFTEDQQSECPHEPNVQLNTDTVEFERFRKTETEINVMTLEEKMTFFRLVLNASGYNIQPLPIEKIYETFELESSVSPINISLGRHHFHFAIMAGYLRYLMYQHTYFGKNVPASGHLEADGTYSNQELAFYTAIRPACPLPQSRTHPVNADPFIWRQIFTSSTKMFKHPLSKQILRLESLLQKAEYGVPLFFEMVNQSAIVSQDIVFFILPVQAHQFVLITLAGVVRYQNSVLLSQRELIFALQRIFYASHGYLVCPYPGLLETVVRQGATFIFLLAVAALIRLL